MKMKKKVSRIAEEGASSAQIVASIDDLLAEILLRLPIKSLVRFKLVSHHWHSLLLTPQFDLLLNPVPNPAIGLSFLSSTVDLSYTYIPFSLKESRKDPPFTKLNFAPEPSGIRISQSCNGLLLCRSNRETDCYRKYYVYNPTTKKFSKLPKLDGDEGICGMYLAFNPTKSPHYRAICVRIPELGYNEGYQYQIEVHSSEVGPSWRKCGVPFRIEADFGCGTHWNGAVHWIGESGACWYFNPDHEKPDIRVMPPIPDGGGINSCLVESCDHLHHISRYCDQLNVYEMKRDYSEWFVKYRVNLIRLAAAYPGIVRHYNHFRQRYVFSVLTLVRGEREEDSFLVLQMPGKLVRYDLVRSFQPIFLFEGGEDSPCSSPGFQHIESRCCV